MIGDARGALAGATGVADNTYIVFSSDNGFHMGEHRLRQGKMTAFDTDIHVPLIVTGPGVPRAGTSTRVDREHRPVPDVPELGRRAVAARRRAAAWCRCCTGAPGRHWRDAALVEHHGPDTDQPTPTRRRPAAATRRRYEAIRTQDPSTSSTPTASASTTT